MNTTGIAKTKDGQTIYQCLFLRDMGKSQICNAEVFLMPVHDFSLVARDGTVVATYDYFTFGEGITIDCVDGRFRVYSKHGWLEYDPTYHAVKVAKGEAE